MSNGGNITLEIKVDDVMTKLSALLDHVNRGTKKATIAACEEISKLTLAQVPRESGALADSFDYEVTGSYTNFEATIGYGLKPSVNPRTGEDASEYMVAVHEDLNKYHPHGKAKFFEDPLNDYKSQFVSRAGVTIQRSIEGGE